MCVLWDRRAPTSVTNACDLALKALNADQEQYIPTHNSFSIYSTAITTSIKKKNH